MLTVHAKPFFAECAAFSNTEAIAVAIKTIRNLRPDSSSEVECLLNSGPRDEDKPLFSAIKYGCVDTVRVLLENGALPFLTGEAAALMKHNSPNVTCDLEPYNSILMVKDTNIEASQKLDMLLSKNYELEKPYKVIELENTLVDSVLKDYDKRVGTKKLLPGP